MALPIPAYKEHPPIIRTHPNPSLTIPLNKYPTPRYPCWVRNSSRVAALACHQPPNQKPKRQVLPGLERTQAAAQAMATTAGPAATPGRAGRRRRPATRCPPSRGQVNCPKKCGLSRNFKAWMTEMMMKYACLRKSSVFIASERKGIAATVVEGEIYTQYIEL